ncbi:MAG TPA: hypothetical protein P5551_05730 [Syntrophales bacterium]|nr:hypothetical protein [Syntrophales bacterium]
MKQILIFICCLTLFVTYGCATTGPTTEKTQLQIREFQTRSYSNCDSKMVMKAMLNVLQDDGYIVKNAVTDMGLLSAEKTVDVQNLGEAVAMAFFAGVHARWKKASVVECTANVSDYGKQTRVRVNFQVKVFDNKGGILEVKQIEDQKFYQDFFTKVDKAVYIQKEKI